MQQLRLENQQHVLFPIILDFLYCGGEGNLQWNLLEKSEELKVATTCGGKATYYSVSTNAIKITLCNVQDVLQGIS